MKLLSRILAAPLVAVVFLAASGAASDWALHNVVDNFQKLRNDKLSAAHNIADVKARMATANALLYRTINLIDSLDAKAVEALRQRVGDELQTLAAGLTALAPQVDPALRPDLEGLTSNLGKYRQNALQALTLAEASTGAAITVLASAERNFNASATALQKVSDAVDADIASMSQDVVSTSDRAFVLTITLTLAAFAVSGSLAWWMARRIVLRLDHAVGISEAIARGELDMTVPEGDHDEVGRLLQSLRGTVQRLGGSLREIQLASGSIHIATAEIAAGSQNLSSRTERTAGSLQHTAGSLGQLTSAVDKNASTAREANVLAESACNLASHGGEVVARVVATMQDIHASSRQIADIIGVIDGIAFQTNILALNAAVEAARAGDQGRGFAVVASEVRGLALRSAESARQIKTLIGASVDKAETGARLVGDAGTAMTDIVASIRRVGSMIAHISAANGDQSTGIASVNQAIHQLDQMTQQNAALVEQSATASQSLNAQASRLTSVVGSFRLLATQ